MKMQMVALVLLLLFARMPAQTQIILDADTANEMDDFYAIVAALLDTNLHVTALISAHFNNTHLVTDSVWHNYPTKDINTVQLSQTENLKLLNSLNIAIPHPIGCDRMVGYFWGYYPGAPIPESPGVDTIIAAAQNASPTEKLNIVCLGAVTNVAAAILTEPGIAKNIRLYALNMKYDFDKQAWNKNSFNARVDVNALDVVLNHRDLELFIMPGTVARELVFERQTTLAKLGNLSHPTARILEERWDQVNAGDTWIMWDVALVEAIAHPDFATRETFTTPPENTHRSINAYSDIDAEQMKENVWRKLETLDSSE